MLVLTSIVLAFILAAVSGGQVLRLKTVHLRFEGLMLFSAALHYLAPQAAALVGCPNWVGTAVWMGALVGLLGVSVLNARRYPALYLVASGVLLNILVVAANGWSMPVLGSAVAASGSVLSVVDALDENMQFHVLAGPETRLLLLADVMPLPAPIVRSVISLGDLAMALGVVVFVVAASHSPCSNSSGLQES